MTTLYVWTVGDTVTTLAETIDVTGYYCSLWDVHGKLDDLKTDKPIDNSKPYYLCSDFCADVFVNNITLPVLRQLRFNGKGSVQSEVNLPIWNEVIRRHISKMRLYICDEKGNILSFKGKGLYCTLKLVKKFNV